MTDIKIPTRLDFMYPTLVAVRDMGGSATKSELLEKVHDYSGFPNSASRYSRAIRAGK